MLIFKRSDQLPKQTTQIFIPIIDGKVVSGDYGKLFDLDLQEQLTFFAPADKPIKAGEIFEIPISMTESMLDHSCKRISMVSLGKAEPNELRLAGAAIGRKLRGKSELVFVAVNLKSTQTKALLISANLGNFQWSLKHDQKPSESQLHIPTDDGVISAAQVISDAVNRARELIHTPSNIKNPEWIAKQAKRLANGESDQR